MRTNEMTGVGVRAGQAGVLLFPGIVTAVVAMPVFVVGPLAFAIRRDFSLSSVEIGVVFSGFFLASALFASVGGWLTTRLQTTAVVRAGLVCCAASSVPVALSQNKVVLIVGCLAAGAMNGVIAPALNISITRRVPAGRQGLAFGIKVAAVPATASFAALGAYAVADLGWKWYHLYWLSALLCVVVAASMGVDRNDHPTDVSTPRSHREPIARGALALLGVGGLLAASGCAVMTPFLVDGLIAQGQTPGRAAAILAVAGWVAIGARVVAGAVSDRLPEPMASLRAVAWMLLAGCTGMVGLAFGGSDVVLVGATLVAFGLGWAWPGLLHLAVLRACPESPGLATGYMQTGTFMGALLGPLGFGLVAAQFSFRWAWGLAAAAVLLAAGLLVAGVRQLGSHGSTSRLQPIGDR
jgi:MFS family permease